MAYRAGYVMQTAAGYPRYNLKSRRFVGLRRRPRASLFRRLYGGRRLVSVRPGRSVALRNIRTGGLLSIEKKFLDCGLTPTTLGAPTDATGGEVQPDSGCTGCLTAPAQGDGPTNRDGKQIALMSIEVKGVLGLISAGTLSEVQTMTVPDVYLALVLDTQTNGVTINSEDVFQNISAEAAAAASPFHNMSNTSRFRVLKTQVVPSAKFAALVAANNAAATTISHNSSQVPFALRASLKGIKVNFTTASTTADVANVVDNSVHLIAFASVAASVSLAGASRLRFVG